MRRTFPGLALAVLILAAPARTAEKNILVVAGDFLAYSYDHGQIYGEKVAFEFLGYKVRASAFKSDLTARLALAAGGVTLVKEGETLAGDELLLSLDGTAGTLIRYGEAVETKTIGEEGKEAPAEPGAVLDDITLSRIRRSLIAFVAREISVTESFEVVGTGVMLYLEGIESVGFKRFKLSDGVGRRRNGFSVNRIWYSKSRGLVGRASFSIEKENKLASLTQLNYEERSFLKENYGIERQADLLTSTSWTLNEKLRMGFAGNYNSSSLWTAQAWIGRNWSPSFNTQFDFAYNKPIGYRGEAWLGVQSMLSGGKWGNLAVLGRYELQNQVLASLGYDVSFLNHFSLNLQSLYSRVRMGESDAFAEIITGGLNLSYSSRLFNLGTDYFLNADLFGHQTLSQPQLRIGLNPVSFYGGLLALGLSNIAIFNRITRESLVDRSYSNNTALTLATQPMDLGDGLRLSLNLALEQFVEKMRRNFTTGGFIFTAVREFREGISVEAYYSIHSRRRTRGWLIEGTTSQDLSLVGRAVLGDALNSWVSLSYDPKNRQMRQSFADVSFKVVQNWGLHALLNYDFFLKKLNNIDLYLTRDAGRFQLRLIWRSLSKQFLVEMAPR